jgi:type IV pilus assembly protein PilA
MHSILERRSRGAAGFSLIELIVVVAIIMIVAAIAIPRMLSSKMRANETAVVEALRSIATGQTAYYSTFQRGFAPSLEALGPPPSGDPASADRANLIDPLLATGARNGYIFDYQPGPLDSEGRISTYRVNANPVKAGQTGTKFFYMDEKSVIRFSLDGPAGPDSPIIPQG